MKLLTLPQPYATLLAHRRKVLHTFAVPTDYRGLIAIHAASSITTEHALAALDDPIRPILEELGHSIATCPRRAIIAVGELVDCWPLTWQRGEGLQPLPEPLWSYLRKEAGLSPLPRGGYAYRFERVVPIEPICDVPGSASPSTVRGELANQLRSAHLRGIDLALSPEGIVLRRLTEPASSEDASSEALARALSPEPSEPEAAPESQ